MGEPAKLPPRKGAGLMLHMAEMAVVQDAHRMQPAELQALGDAYLRAKGLPEVDPLPGHIRPPPILSRQPMLVPALLICLVVGITDGDTLTARCDEQTLKIRLAEIDAPEKAQPFGARSKQHLSDLCFDVEAEVYPQTTDRYGRTVAHVTCDGVDVTTEQVRSGMAWVYDKYALDKSLYAVQDDAKAARLGLWSDAEAMPPWEWRSRGK